MTKDEGIPNIEKFKNNLGKIAYTLDKEYFSRLDNDYYVLPYDECYNSEEITDNNGRKTRIEINSYVSNIRAMKINRLVHNKEDNFIDCFQNTLSVFSNTGNTIALVFNRYINHTDIYAVVKNNGQGKNEESKKNIELLKNSFEGNFSGSEFAIIDEHHSGNDTKKIFFNNKEENLMNRITSIAAVCNIPSEKSEDYLSQNLEKIFNGVVPKTDDEWYSVIIFAESITTEQLHLIREGYEEMASDIFPFQQHQFQAGENTAETHGEMKSLAHSETTSVAISKTHSVNAGITSTADGNGGSISGHLGYGYSWGKTTSKGISDTTMSGTNHSITLGNSENTTYTYQSYTIKSILERLESSLERLKIGEGIGIWKYSSFVCSQSPHISKNIANQLRAITQGKHSYLEPAIIKEWYHEEGNGSIGFNEIKKYIFNFSHPVFVNKVDGTAVNFASNINTSELANIMALPQHSIPGLPVTNGVSFGREPHSISKTNLDLDIGFAYHMYQENKNQIIKICQNNLTAHTFVTGSTGSGKSNTIYKVIYECCFNQKSNKKFLVIESAKGEYKNIFGGYDSVSVYGTNIRKSALLKINPFVFPDDDITVAEHIDRLIEIFNACWPMYAAMPAVLKEAIEAAYVSCGWSITRSVCIEPKRFPTFATLLSKLPDIINTSAYSKDTKSDYIGALVTRVKSLTNGINGIIFCADDDNITDEQLFENNVIIDISRVGSSETKALIMGMLVIKLQEYRMLQSSQGTLMNSDLRHITVLEEAHNLLRRTSSEQSQESSNLQGKSVEMLANAIAEMRTYGEGFIIADQSPGLLDMSVIRNTNTKIIMHLPDESDRELAGKAAGLNDEQIKELAKLDVGVAAVYQNHWIEPVLCKVDEFKDEKAFKYPPNDNWSDDNYFVYPEREKLFKYIANDYKENLDLSKEEIDKLYKWIDRIPDSKYTAKAVIRSILKNNKVIQKEYNRAIYYLIDGKSLLTDNFSYRHKLITQEIMEKLCVTENTAQKLTEQMMYYKEIASKIPELNNYRIGGIR